MFNEHDKFDLNDPQFEHKKEIKQATQQITDNEFMRYSRQLLLEDIDIEGQRKLKNAKVLIVGIGGLGAPASLYLAAAGVGEIFIADDDELHLSNLQRQILYRTNEINQNKVTLAAQQLNALNPLIKIHSINNRMDQHTINKIIANVDLVLDCTDNMATRHQINKACIQSQTALISGSAVGFSGQLIVLQPPFEYGCYCCLYPDLNEPERNCRTAGVLGPVVGVIGTLQALEAIKLLAGMPCFLAGKLRMFDGKKQNWSTLQLKAAKDCPVCQESIA